MTHRWIVTALGKDRPGIVAGVTQALYRLGCNLEDSAMTRLGGEFAIMLLFSGPARVTQDALRSAFASLEQRLKLVLHLKPLSGGATQALLKRGAAYLVSVYGADRPGIVFRVADLLARAGINITNVETHRSPSTSGRTRPPLYLLLLEVELPTSLSVARLEHQLKALAKKLAVEVSLRPAEADVL